LPTREETFTVLFVCTGNICRSPMAAELLRAALQRDLGLAASSFRISSAGTYGLIGQQMEPDAVAVLGEYGITPAPFSARELVADQVSSADLVLTMERPHRAAVVTLVPSAASRTFTLREFTSLIAAVEAAELPGPDNPVARARSLVELARSRRGLVRPDRPEQDDIADPYRAGTESFRRAAGEIATCVLTLSALLADTVPSR
jgi:protein-tyrosine phosphatase